MYKSVGSGELKLVYYYVINILLYYYILCLLLYKTYSKSEVWLKLMKKTKYDENRMLY